MEEFPDRKIFPNDSLVRRCTKCREIKSRSEFYKASKKNKYRRLDNYCKICRKKLTAQNYGRFAAPYRFVKDAKIKIARGTLECACCGNKNFEWLQIDHKIALKANRGIRSKIGESTQKLTREIIQGKRSAINYQLLCANCNFAKSALDKCPIDHSLDY